MKIDEFEFRNKQGKESEPTKNQLVIYIKSLQKEIKELKKALELACKEITVSCEYCSYKTRIECPVEADCLDEKINYFKTKAKEMLGSE